jgi:hypothetical protein
LDAQKFYIGKYSNQMKQICQIQPQQATRINNLMQISQNILINLKSLFSKTYKTTKREKETRAYLEQKKNEVMQRKPKSTKDSRESRET